MVTIEAETLKKLIAANIPQTGFRVLMFLLAGAGRPVSTVDISSGVGCSKKTASKTIRRLVSAGIIELGPVEDRRRHFTIPGNIPGGGCDEPRQTVGEQGFPDMTALYDRIDALEKTIAELASKMEIFSAIREPDFPVMPPGSAEPESQKIPKQTLSEPVSVIIPPNVTLGIPGMVTNDTLSVNSFPAAAASFNIKNMHAAADEKSIDAAFNLLFGVSIPSGGDRVAAAEMIRRKNAGKLANIINPIGYLQSLAGKITAPSEQIQHPAPSMPAVNAKTTDQSPYQTHGDEINRAIDRWFALSENEREKFIEPLRVKHQTMSGKYRVPVDLLARNEFIRQELESIGVRI